MKRIILLLFFTSFINIYSQKQVTFSLELFLNQENIDNNVTVTYYLDALSPVYNGNNLISNYDILHSINEITGNYLNGNYGWDIVGSASGEKIFGYGLYRLTNNISEKSIIIDYRDCDARDYNNTIDLTIKYDSLVDSFSVSKGVPSLAAVFSTLTDQEIIQIWKIKGQGLPKTDCFLNFWQNSLVLLNYKNHPELVWGVYPDKNKTVISYKIYKKRNMGNYNLLTEVPSNQLTYVDLSEVIFSGIGKPENVKYYVIATFDDGVISEQSNTVYTNVLRQINKQSPPRYVKSQHRQENFSASLISFLI